MHCAANCPNLPPNMSESPLSQLTGIISHHSPVRSQDSVPPSHLLSTSSKLSTIMSPFVPKMASSPKFTNLKSRNGSNKSKTSKSDGGSKCVFYFSDMAHNEQKHNDSNNPFANSPSDSDYGSIGKGVFDDNASHEEHDDEDRGKFDDDEDEDELQKMVNEYLQNGLLGDDLSLYEPIENDKNDFKINSVENNANEISDSGFVHTTLNHFSLNSDITNHNENHLNHSSTRLSLKRKLDSPITDSDSSSGASSLDTGSAIPSPASGSTVSLNPTNFLSPSVDFKAPVFQSLKCASDGIEKEEIDLSRQSPEEKNELIGEESVIFIGEDKSKKKKSRKPLSERSNQQQPQIQTPVCPIRRSTRNRVPSVRYSDERPVYQWLPEDVIPAIRRKKSHAASTPADGSDNEYEEEDEVNVIRLPVLVGKCPKSQPTTIKGMTKHQSKQRPSVEPETAIKSKAKIIVKPHQTRLLSKKSQSFKASSLAASASTSATKDDGPNRWKESRSSDGVKIGMNQRFSSQSSLHSVNFASGKMRLEPLAEKSRCRTKLFTVFNVIRGSVQLRHWTVSPFDLIKARKSVMSRIKKREELEDEDEEDDVDDEESSKRNISTESIFTEGDQFVVDVHMDYELINLNRKQDAELNFILIKQ